MHESVGIDHDVYSRINAAWSKWQEVTGVVCDRRIPPKLKGLIYKSIIRPVLWWMCGVTRSDRTRNTFIRGSLGVRDVADKLQERRLR